MSDSDGEGPPPLEEGPTVQSPVQGDGTVGGTAEEAEEAWARLVVAAKAVEALAEEIGKAKKGEGGGGEGGEGAGSGGGGGAEMRDSLLTVLAQKQEELLQAQGGGGGGGGPGVDAERVGLEAEFEMLSVGTELVRFVET